MFHHDKNKQAELNNTNTLYVMLQLPWTYGACCPSDMAKLPANNIYKKALPNSEYPDDVTSMPEEMHTHTQLRSQHFQIAFTSCRYLHGQDE